MFILYGNALIHSLFVQLKSGFVQRKPFHLPHILSLHHLNKILFRNFQRADFLLHFVSYCPTIPSNVD